MGKKYNDIEDALKSCVTDTEMHNNIHDCAENAEGNRLQHETALATPTHEYVPWITYNGDNSDKTQNALMDDMTGFLCGLDVNKDKAICENYYMVGKTITKEKDYSVCENIFLGLKFLA